MIRWSKPLRILGALAVIVGVSSSGASAQEAEEHYDDQLLRLAEILGAIHHLRDICGFDEGQLWREKMLELLEVEDPPGQFRARMIASFNTGSALHALLRPCPGTRAEAPCCRSSCPEVRP